MRSSSGAILEAAPAFDVQGSKSYMDVSMSEKRMSSKVRSVRKPVEVVNSKFPGRESISFGSLVLFSCVPSDLSVPAVTIPSLRSAAAIASVEVDVGQSSSISSKAEEKLSFTGWTGGSGEGGGCLLLGLFCWTVWEVQNVSSSSREAGVRQDSSGVVFIKSVGWMVGWDARWLKAG